MEKQKVCQEMFFQKVKNKMVKVKHNTKFIYPKILLESPWDKMSYIMRTINILQQKIEIEYVIHQC